MNRIAPYLKTLVGFVAPGFVGLVAAVQDGSKGGERITSAEWVTVVAACVLTAAGVYATPNRDPRAQHQDESVQPPHGRHEAGQVDPWTLILGIIALAVVLWFLFWFLPLLLNRG